MDADIQNDSCNETITVAAYQGTSSTTGAPSYAAYVSYAARIERQAKVFEVSPGTRVATSYAIMTPADVNELDAVKLPGSTKVWKAQVVKKATDEYGAHDHSIIYL